MSSSKTIIRSIAILSFVLTIAALIISWNSPATGFEASIYSHTPISVWLFFFFSIVCGISIVVHQVYTKEYKGSSLWVVGLLLVVFPWVSILLLPTIRGYLLSGNLDNLVQLGHTTTIISTGHASAHNSYPASHIFVAALSQIVNVEPIVLFRYIPVLFNVLYVVSMFLLARCILPHKGQAILVTAAAAIIAFRSVSMFPWNLASLTLPLALLLFVRGCGLHAASIRWGFRFLFIFVLLVFPFFHILVAFTISLILLAIWFSGKLWVAWSKRPTFVNKNLVFIIFAFTILFICSIVWVKSLPVWEWSLASLEVSATGFIPPFSAEAWLTPQEIEMGVGYSHFQILLRNILYAQSYGYSVAAQFLKVYGVPAVYLSLALLAFFMLRRRRFANPELGNLFSWYGPLAICAIVLVTLYMTNLAAWPGRLVYHMAIISALFVGFVFYEILERVRSSSGKMRILSTLFVFLIPLVLILGCVNRVLMQYPSSYNFACYDHQLSRTEVAGMDWFLHNQDTTTGTVQIHLLYSRYADFLLTPEERMQREKLPGWFTFQRPPFHFGYPEYSTVGAVCEEDNYMVLGELDEVMYEEILPRMAEYRFSRSDFDRLEDDPSLDRLYANGEFTVWFIHASGEPASLVSHP